jgi:hypothetical protein
MICKKCGNKQHFNAVVTDYKPLELWEISEGVLTRYCQKDSGDVDIVVECASCGSSDIDKEGFDTSVYTERPLVIMSEEEWDQKAGEVKKVEIAEEEEEEKDEEELKSEGETKPEEDKQE